jgi:hypothetical protein
MSSKSKTQTNSNKNLLTIFLKKKYDVEKTKNEFENLLYDKNIALKDLDYLELDELICTISSAFSSLKEFVE